MRKFRKKSWMLRVAAVNTHVNVGLRNGVLQWLMRKHKFLHAMLLSEVHDEAALNRHIPHGWERYPQRQPGEKPNAHGNEAGTYIIWNPRRLVFTGGVNEDISGVKWPRRMTAGRFVDRRTGRIVYLSSHHPDPLNARDWSDAVPHVKRAHIRQVAKFVAYHLDGMMVDDSGDDVHISGGDTNENTAVLRDDESARQQFAEIGMVPTWRSAERRSGGDVGLMTIFSNVKRELGSVKWHRTYETGIKGMDHEVAVAGIRITRRS